MFVLFHSISLFIYAAPASIVPGGGKKIVSPYVYPLFDQTWSMFAPCPTVDGKIKVNIQHKNGETGWFYPLESDLSWHRTLRMSHHGEMALLELNLIYWVMLDKVDFNLQYDEALLYPISDYFKDGYSYILLKRFVYGIAVNLELEPISAEVVCEIEEVDTGVSGDLIIPEFKWLSNE